MLRFYHKTSTIFTTSTTSFFDLEAAIAISKPVPQLHPRLSFRIFSRRGWASGEKMADEGRKREREGVRHVNLFKHNRSGTRSTRTPPVWEVRRCFTIKVRNGGRTQGLFRHDPLSPLCRFFPCAPPLPFSTRSKDSLEHVSVLVAPSAEFPSR